MNRFTRNNLSLIVIIACACVASVALLVFSAIRFMEMSDCMAEVENCKKQKDELERKNPSPHPGNRKPIETNTANFNAAADRLAVYFTPPMKALAEEFVTGLIETELNKPEKDDNGKPRPLTVEKFRRDYEEMWNKGQSYVDKDYNYNNFKERNFTNWNAQVSKYLKKAQALTAEPLNENNLPEVLFSYIGIPRVMGEQPDRMIRFMKNYQNALVLLMTSMRFNTETKRVDWFGFDPDPTVTQIIARFNNPRDHYPQVARLWDVYGDVIKRMSGCTMKISFKDKRGKDYVVPYNKEFIDRLNDEKRSYTLFDDRIRDFYGLELRAAMGNNATNLEQFRNAVGGNEDGPFRVYRMRLTVGATMDGVRTLIRALEEAYKDHHVYVVRSVALYAQRDGAKEVFNAREAELNPTAERPQVQNTPAPRRGRGRGRVVEAAPRNESGNNTDPELLARLKREQEERIKKMPPNKRPGYGAVLIGDDRYCKAVIDFDCYQMK